MPSLDRFDVPGLSPRMRGNRNDDEVATLIRGTIPAHAGEPWGSTSWAWHRRDYPRACGGTRIREGRNAVEQGLSPRMRGNPRKSRSSARPARTIPAHAGEPILMNQENKSTRDYPRACGGTIPGSPIHSSTLGLSPRMRGNLYRLDDQRQLDGTIPAHAGEPSSARISGISSRDYPRACGGTGRSASIASPAAGLSPRMRGNRLFPSARDLPLGTIPAHAGEPAIITTPHGCAWDYPRACGGTFEGVARQALAGGLSPRMRGNLAGLSPGKARLGTIPAHAGEPSLSSRRRILPGDYPRACGGTGPGESAKVTATGLSPRMRGNRGVMRLAALLLGTIPAHAGEPGSGIVTPPDSWDYPRACGGTRTAEPLERPCRGLSPRMRGNRHLLRGRRIPIGTIPAHAGEPWRTESAATRRRDYPRACGGTAFQARAFAVAQGLSPRMRGNRRPDARR